MPECLVLFMFEKFVEDYLDALINDAKDSDHIVQYDNIPVYEEILNYCKQNNLMISNVSNMIDSFKRVGVGDIAAKCGGPLNAYSSDILKEYSMDTNPMTKFIIYGPFIFKHANNLANQICINHTQFVELFTTLKGRLFNMKVSGEAGIITFVDIRTEFIKLAPAIAGKWLPPNIELINIYHQLYAPQFYCNRNILIEHESKCWPLFLDMHDTKCKPLKRSFPYNSVVLTWLKNRSDCILIGPMATTHANRNNYKIQIVTSMPSGHIADEIKLLMRRVAKLPNIESRSYLAENIPGEYRLTKTIMYNKNDHIVEIFNTASYDLIPYIVVDDIQVGLPYTLLYHMILDVWFIGTLGERKTLPQRAVKHIICGYIDIMKHVRAKKYNIDKPMFMGTYKDDSLAKKRLSLSNRIRPYYPAQTKIANGDYRVI